MRSESPPPPLRVTLLLLCGFGDGRVCPGSRRASVVPRVIARAGEATDELFSSPKVQIMRITDKYLTDAPVAPTDVILRELPQVVGAVACFAGYLCAEGTSAEAAELLAAHAAGAAAAAQTRAAAESAAKRAVAEERAELRAAGAVIVGDHGSDLEDDVADVPEVHAAGDDVAVHAAGDERAVHAAGDDVAVRRRLLSCVSLAKVVDLYVQAQPFAPQAKALASLLKFDDAADSECSRTVHMPQVRWPSLRGPWACAPSPEGRSIAE